MLKAPHRPRPQQAALAPQLLRKVACLALLALLTPLGGCLPEEVLVLELDQGQPELMVESYLRPGQPVRISLTNSYGAQVDLQDTSDILQFVNEITVPDAQVFLLYKGDSIPCRYYNLFAENNQYTLGEYRAERRGVPFIVPNDYENDFGLYIRHQYVDTTTGDTVVRTVTARTRLMRPVAIDTFFFERSGTGSTFARVEGRWNDPQPGQTNYYRVRVDINLSDSVRLLLNELEGEEADSLRDLIDDKRQVLRFDDKVVQDLFILTDYDYQTGDTVFMELYHINQEYFEYAQSVAEARGANFNPFEEPNPILSTVQGGLGVFTGVGYQRRELFIPS